MKIENNENKKITSIILLTDFSDNAKNAISYAISAFGETVKYKLVNSYYVKTNSGTLLDLNDILAKESAEELAKEEQWVQESFSTLNLSLETHSIFGSPVDAINKLKKGYHDDLVIMGTKGASGFDAILYGSVAASVIKATIIPVLSIPPEYIYSEIGNIVFSTDGQDIDNDNVLNPIEKIQDHFDSKLTVLTIENPSGQSTKKVVDLNLTNAHYSAIESENIVEEVIQYCIDEKADMLVLLPKHNSFFSRLFHKSISRQIIQRLKIPILSLENTKS